MTSTAPLATILNPADKADHLLFYLSTNGDLAMVDRTLTETESASTDSAPGLVYSAPSNPKGIVANPSSLAAFQHKKKVEVWGISKETKLVTRLSPGIMYLKDADTTGNTASIAGASNGRVEWLYYLKASAPGNSTTLGEYQVGKGNLNKLNITPHQKTSLAAIHTGTLRFVVWQDSQGLINATEAEGPTYATIQGTRNAKEGSPLALAFDPAAKQLHVYYVGDRGMILKSVRSVEGKWSKVDQVKTDDDEPLADDLSGLSAVNCGSYNLLTFVSTAHGETRYAAFRDEIKTA